MPSKVQADLVREHGESIASLTARLDEIRSNSDRIEQHAFRIEQAVSAEGRTLAEIRGELPVVVRDIEKLEKRVDELLLRRWELWKLLLAAVLGGLLSFAATTASKLIVGS